MASESEIPNSMWPLELDLTHDECRGILRQLELKTYSKILGTFRAQGALDDRKSRLLRELRDVLFICEDRHKAECRRVANDERLYTVAKRLVGPNTGYEWSKEGHRNYPLLPRAVPHTALLATANEAKAFAERANIHLPWPHRTRRVTTHDSLPVDQQNRPIIIGDPYAPPEAPKLSQKPLLKRSHQMHHQAHMHAQHHADEHSSVPFALHAVAPIQASLNVRAQELYQQHVNIPMAALGSQSFVPSAEPGTIISAGLHHTRIQSSPTHQTSTPTQTHQQASRSSKRAPKSAPASKTARARKQSRSASGGTPRLSKSAQLAKATAEAVAHGSITGKSRKLAFQHDKPTRKADGDGLQSVPPMQPPSSGTFIWTSHASSMPAVAQPNVTHSAPQQFHMSNEAHTMLQTFAPLTLASQPYHPQSPQKEPPASSLLTQSSPVQVVFTSRPVDVILDCQPSSMDGDNNLINELTPVSWLNGDIMMPLHAPDNGPPIPIIVSGAQQPTSQHLHQHPTMIVVSSEHDVDQQYQHPIMQPMLTSNIVHAVPAPSPSPNVISAASSRSVKPHAQTQRRSTPSNTASHVGPIAVHTKIAKTPRKKQIAREAVLAAQRTQSELSPVRIAAPPLPDSPVEPQIITSRHVTAANAQELADHRELLETTLRLHEEANQRRLDNAQIMNYNHIDSSVPQKMTVSPGIEQKFPQTNLIVQPPTQSSAANCPTGKPKIHITHQEIIVPSTKLPIDSANVAGPMKSMQSKGNVKLVTSANGSITLKGTNPDGRSLPITIAQPPVTTAKPAMQPPIVASNAPANTVQNVGIPAAMKAMVPNATSTTLKRFPKIQLVKARPSGANIAATSKMMLMQKLPSGTVIPASSATVATFSASVAASVSLPSGAITSSAPTRTVKLVPLKTLPSPAKMMIVPTTPTMPSTPLKTIPYTIATSSAVTMPTTVMTQSVSIAPTEISVPPLQTMQITEDTPVDIISGNESTIPTVVLQASPASQMLMPATNVAPSQNTRSPLTLSTTVVDVHMGQKHKLLDHDQTPVAIGASIITPANLALPKRIRIDPKKGVKMASFIPNSGHTVAGTKQSSRAIGTSPSISLNLPKMVAQHPYRMAVSGTMSLPTTTVPVNEPRITGDADSTDWEKELDKQQMSIGKADDKATRFETVELKDDSATTYVNEDVYVSNDEDIIQYEGDEDIGHIYASSEALSTSSTHFVDTREDGESSQTIVMQMEEFDENGQSHMRNVSLEELVDSGHIVMNDS